MGFMRDPPFAVVAVGGLACGLGLVAVWYRFRDQPTELVKDYVSGGVSKAIATTVHAPLEVCKGVLQTQSAHPRVKSGEVQPYTGVVDYFVRTVQEQGVLGLWKGNYGKCLHYFPAKILDIGLKDDVIDHVGRRCGVKWIGTMSWLLVRQAVHYPMELGRRIRIADIDGQYDGKLILQEMHRKHGLSGIYSGAKARAIAAYVDTVFYRGIYFLAYDSGWITKGNSFYAAKIIHLLARLAAYPLERAAVHQNVELAFVAEKPRLHGIRACMRHIIREEGYSGLWAGIRSELGYMCAEALLVMLIFGIREVGGYAEPPIGL